MATEDIILQALMADNAKREARNPLIIGGKIALAQPKANFNNPWAAGLATLGQTLAGGLMTGYGEKQAEEENDKILNAYLTAAAESNREKQLTQLEANPDLAKYGKLAKYGYAKDDRESAKELKDAEALGRLKMDLELAPEYQKKKLDYLGQEEAIKARYRPSENTPIKLQNIIKDDQRITGYFDTTGKFVELSSGPRWEPKTAELVDPILGALNARLAKRILTGDETPASLSSEEESALAAASSEQKRLTFSLINRESVAAGQADRTALTGRKVALAEEKAEDEKKQRIVNSFSRVPGAAEPDLATAKEINKDAGKLEGLFGVLDTISDVSPYAVLGENAALNETASSAAKADLRAYLGLGAALTGDEAKDMDRLNAKGLLDAPFSTIIGSVTGKTRKNVISAIRKVMTNQFEARLAAQGLYRTNKEPSDYVKSILKDKFKWDGDTKPNAEAEAESALDDMLESNSNGN